MKKQQYFWLSLLIIIIFTLASCKKKDFHEIQKKQTNNSAFTFSKDRFFRHSDSLNSRLLNIVNDIKHQDSILNFVEALSQRNGYPIWEETIGNYRLSPDKVIENRNDAPIPSNLTDTIISFIPLKRDDSKNINTVIACMQVGEKFKYKLLQRQLFQYRIATREKGSKYDLSMMSVFTLLEKKINKFDSITFGFAKKITFKNSQIKMRMLNKEVITLDDGFLQFNVTFCLSGSIECDNCVNIARPTTTISKDVAIPICWEGSYWYLFGDDAVGGSGTGGSGTGGVGTGGTGTFGTGGGGTGDPGFVCPITEWYCETGEYRLIDNQLVTQDYYPFKDNRFPWLWWETGNYMNANLGVVFSNTGILNLNVSQAQYLINNSELNFLVSDLIARENNSAEAFFASRLAIEQARLNKIAGPYDAAFLNVVNLNVQRIGCCPTGPVLLPSYLSSLGRRAASIKRDNPGWNYLKCFLEANLEIAHIGFDLLGLIPVGGELFDVANGAIYSLQGDGINATLSYLGAVPIAGWGATGVKHAAKYIHLSDGTKKLLIWYKDADGFIKFGKPNSEQFRKLLGIAVGDPRQAHHIIPWELVDQTGQTVIQKAAQAKFPFHVQDVMNGIPLSTLQHSGSHPNYTIRVNEALNDIKVAYGSNLTPEKAYQEIVNLTNRIKNAIASNPTTKIDNLIF